MINTTKNYKNTLVDEVQERLCRIVIKAPFRQTTSKIVSSNYGIQEYSLRFIYVLSLFRVFTGALPVNSNVMTTHRICRGAKKKKIRYARGCLRFSTPPTINSHNTVMALSLMFQINDTAKHLCSMVENKNSITLKIPRFILNTIMSPNTNFVKRDRIKVKISQHSNAKMRVQIAWNLRIIKYLLTQIST